MKLPDSLNINTLPYITAYQLTRLIEGKQKLVNVTQLKAKRNKAGLEDEAFQLGLAYSIFREIQKYNKEAEWIKKTLNDSSFYY